MYQLRTMLSNLIQPSKPTSQNALCWTIPTLNNYCDTQSFHALASPMIVRILAVTSTQLSPCSSSVAQIWLGEQTRLGDATSIREDQKKYQGSFTRQRTVTKLAQHLYWYPTKVLPYRIFEFRSLEKVLAPSGRLHVPWMQS